MATFSVRFLGCKISYADAQTARESLLEAGHVETTGGGDVAIVNTCCVTQEAVRKSRQAVARAARQNTRVYVTGCAANLDHAFEGMPPNVRVVRGRPEDAAPRIAGDVGAIGCVQADVRVERVRAFVKIQDGCSFGCSFCVIPIVRGQTRSRSADAVLREVRRRALQGHQEIVLSGVNLGLFRDRERQWRLPRLLREIAAVDGVARVRLSSIEVNHLDAELVDALRESANVGKHVHVPLQSGDDGVLRAMRRRYSAAEYLRKLEPLEGFNITTDVIVGFPGEDERAFARTLAVVERGGITKVHVFPYSPRPGTATAAADPVSPAVKRTRSRRLREASAAAQQARWRAKLGSEDTVLVDRPGRGYGDDYSPWLLRAPVGSLVRVRAADVVEEGIVAA